VVLTRLWLLLLLLLLLVLVPLLLPLWLTKKCPHPLLLVRLLLLWH
jgi:hypothetical protein